MLAGQFRARRTTRGVLGLALLASVAGTLPAAQAQGKGSLYVTPRPPATVAIEASALTSMPVKELAVFKDGHAFVLHEGEVPTEPGGDVVLDTLPTPVLGTFWPYSADPQAKLAAVVAGQRKVKWERTALSIRELIEANPGAVVRITEQDGGATREYEATIVGIPKWTPETDDDPPATGSSAPPDAQPRRQPERPAQPPSSVVLVQTQEGVKVLPLERVRDLTFRSAPHTALPLEEQRKLLTLKLDWGGQPARESAKVGMVYLQRGVRWIPNYRADIDGAGHARVKLQATLINELVDLDGATVHLVIGVPSFYFKDTLDPMALQEAAAQLGQYFASGGQPGVQQMGRAFSNAIMAQVQAGEPPVRTGPTGGDVNDSEITAGSRNEDLFVFTVSNVTLRKGERMVIPVAEFELTYEDVFALDVTFAPPPDVDRNYNNQQALELARLMQAPKVMHRIRLRNESAYPLTTAPAVVLRDGQLLAQSLMTYTPIGATVDLDVTTAVEVGVEKSDVETKRTPDAVRWNNDAYTRIDLAGTIKLTNHRPQAVALEVHRSVLGAVESADHDAQIEKVNVFEDARVPPSGSYPYWWYSYNWPWWWHHFNGLGRITWKFELPPGQSIDLAYAWYYYWH